MSVLVNVDNFARAETHRMFSDIQVAAGVELPDPLLPPSPGDSRWQLDGTNAHAVRVLSYCESSAEKTSIDRPVANITSGI